MDIDHIKQLYTNKSDEELISVLQNQNDYTKETLKVVENIVRFRGGKERLMEQVEFEQNWNNESQELKRVSHILLKKGNTIAEIKEKVNCKYLSEPEIDEVLKACQGEYQLFQKDQKITAGSLIMGIVGGVIGGLIGGFFWGLMMMKSGRIFYIMAFGLFLCSYFFIWLFTRKSLDNKANIAIMMGSILLALVVGQFMFEIFGPADYLPG